MFPEGWGLDIRAALTNAEREARRMGHRCVDVPHIIFGFTKGRRGSFMPHAMAAFGARARELRAAARELAQSAEAPEGMWKRLPGLSLPLSARAAKLMERADAVERKRERGLIDGSLVLCVAATEAEFGAREMLAGLGVDVDELLGEIQYPMIMGTGGLHPTPRLNAHRRARDRRLTGRLLRVWRWIRPEVRIIKRVDARHPFYPSRLMHSLANRAANLDGETFLVTAADFENWVSEELRRAPWFNAAFAFKRALESLPEDDRFCRLPGMITAWPDPTTYHGKEIRACRSAGAIRLRVTGTWTRPSGSPRKHPRNLLHELATAVRERGESSSAIPRERFCEFVSARTRRHPEFDADACFDGVMAILDQPRSKRNRVGPTRQLGRPTMWVYTDGRQILVSRRLGLWTRVWLWWRSVKMRVARGARSAARHEQA